MCKCQILNSDGAVRCTREVDEILSLLADSRCRTVIAILESASKNRMDRTSLLDSLPTSGRMTAEDWELELVHVHVPMLEECGLIEYDARTETIRYCECELVSNVLESVERTTS